SQGQQLYALENLKGRRHGCRYAHVSRKLRKNMRRPLNPVFHGSSFGKLGPNPLGIHRTKPACRDAFYESAKTLRGGNPARRGMRLREITLFGQICHDIPDCGRTKIVIAQLRDSSRADRFSSLDIRPDDRVQYLLNSSRQRWRSLHGLKGLLSDTDSIGKTE